VGREEQLTQFAANLDVPTQDPRRRFVFSIHGDGGVGKTFLMRQLQRIAGEHRAAVAYVDETVFSAPEAMAEIATQMASQGIAMKDFLRLAENYRQRRSEVEADPHAPTGIASFMTRTAARIGVEALRSVPGVGGLAAVVDGEALADQADHLRRFLGEKLRHEDVRMLLSPVEALTPTFVRELAAGARERPLAMFFDTFERTSPFLNDWILALLEGRYGQLSAELVITIAGRDPVDPGTWSPYLGILADVPLAPFDEAEARQLLHGKGITDKRVTEVILKLSGGLPLLVAMLAEHRPADATAVGDPTGDAVERFLKWESDPAKRALAVTAALPRSVNEDILGELIDGHAETHQHFMWLRSLSFVTHQSGRCRYHSVVRSAMLRLERGQSPNRWSEHHRQLASFHRSLRQALNENDAWGEDTWRDLRLEEAYHELCAGSTQALRDALTGLVYVLGEGADNSTAWIQAIRQAGEDAGTAVIQRWGAQLAQAQLDADGEDIAVTDLLLRDAGLNSDAKAEAFRIRGRGYRDRGQYEKALADFNRALELNPNIDRAIGGRGETYRLMGRYEEALADFTRSLELDPDVWEMSNRGETYRLMGRYEEALADFTRSLELDPAYAWAMGSRGQTYKAMGRHEDALADFTRALELNPDYAWAMVSRGQTYKAMGRHEDALADFTRALELNPDYAWAMGNRGETYRLMGRYQEALADFTRALELNPDYAWAMVSRGQTYEAMGRFEEALADLDQALEHDPEYMWALGSRGYLYRLLGCYEEALADLNRALEHDPDDVWALGSRGNVYRLLGRYEEALADLNRSLELDPKEGWNHIVAALVWLHLTNEPKAALCLSTAARMLEHEIGAEAQGNMILCCVAQHASSEARRLTSEFVETPSCSGRLREFRVALGELVDAPGIDQSLIDELLILTS
jgi:tetratricopeptide (TPR) repeat protein